MSKKNPKVDAYIDRAKQWQGETKKLRSILIGCGLGEELKWGKPCYTHGEANLAIIQGFKEHCSVMFFKGSLLKDPKKHLVRPGEHSQAGKRMEFTSLKKIKELEPVLKSFVDQAIAVEEAGLKVDFKEKHELELPDELTNRLAGDPDLSAAFDGLTPGRRRAYVLHFTAAKQSATRATRIEKCVERILAGKGLNDF
ncbi:MAG: YdeI/OmpD-associated family protein [Myxococcales bacterium]